MMRMASWSAGVAASLYLTVSAHAQQPIVLVCDCIDNPNFTTETYVLDERNGTVNHQSTLVRTYAYTVPAQFSDRQYRWTYGQDQFTVDRYSGLMTRSSPLGVINWRCKKAERQL